jgi:hypothetical protein
VIGIIALVLWIGSAAFVGGVFVGIRHGVELEKDRRIRNGGR